MPQGDAELMAKEQILGFKPAPRLEQIDNEHSKQVRDCEHRPQSCADSASQCGPQAGWNFRKDYITVGTTPLAPTTADPFTPEDFTFQVECRFDPAIS